ncbi:MAG: hypothetical protein BGO70_00805 [Bacteroidetes bacterium 43-93]|nr:hypothetical protein [Bacteroidota bacterium]OJW96254.1 MAG: hypothetical protein BGO70_00805 [Bacteroidetes bacterium 43-93]
MARKATLFIIAVILASALISCGKKVDCEDGHLFVHVPADSTLYIVSSYQKDGSFTQSVHVDSLHNGGTIPISTQYDWLVLAVSKNKEYKITNYYYQSKRKRVEGSAFVGHAWHCTNDLYYTVNGIEYQVKGDTWRDDNGQGYETIEIK